MSHVFRLISLGALVAVVTVGCAIPPPPGTPTPPAAQVVPTDTRVSVYGSTIEEVVQNPAIGDKIRAMFGADWNGGQLVSPGASAYFARGGPPQIVRIGGADYIAFSGCVPRACDAGRVLLLIREGGSEIVARLDEGGFAHYYAFGNVTRNTAQLVADSGLRALRQAGAMS
jgi:hypothetical protein